jgi:hypothetical protein
MIENISQARNEVPPLFHRAWREHANRNESRGLSVTWIYGGKISLTVQFLPINVLQILSDVP